MDLDLILLDFLVSQFSTREEPSFWNGNGPCRFHSRKLDGLCRFPSSREGKKNQSLSSTISEDDNGHKKQITGDLQTTLAYKRSLKRISFDQMIKYGI
ncbi:hypothetical protein CEXT_435141 [Caerostris extrusa]|uniref:Uncharacterized protein n=1 Tax=Caerostris extrusa TaxID=172846 RepID=A0AAV4RSJ4_CAEEX|nr:hypothetical protein CEXT_435141 [Caerostris extrusa]